MTFRKQAISTLKQLRADGIELHISLTASNQALHAELVRIDVDMAAAEAQLVAQLEPAKPAEVTALVAAAPVAMVAPAAPVAPRGEIVVAEPAAITVTVETISAQQPMTSAQRIARRAAATQALAAHLFSIVLLLVELAGLLCQLVTQVVEPKVAPVIRFAQMVAKQPAWSHLAHSQAAQVAAFSVVTVF